MKVFNASFILPFAIKDGKSNAELAGNYAGSTRVNAFMIREYALESDVLHKRTESIKLAQLLFN